ncbi:MAG: ankyrin repeat domain-containing protein [Elusimicrobia bacterium]|nr:ankyrin repeat domain-containing protein [Elusimicrobiota bacterium]
MKVLLEHGADPNIGIPFGKAAYAGQTRIVGLLLQHGADPDSKGYQRPTALEDASYQGRLDAVKTLVDCGASPAGGLDSYWVCTGQESSCPKDAILRLLAQAQAEGPERRARSLALARVASTPSERRSGLAGGRIVWEANPFKDSGFKLDSAASPWANVEAAAGDLLRRDLERFVGGPRPQAPKLVQGDYEPAAAFQSRVAKEKRSYEEAVAAHDKKASDYPSWRRNAVLQEALSIVFGSPKVVQARDYDPNTQTFSPQVASESPYAKDFRQAFVLRETIPPEQAQAFDGALQSSNPRLVFERHGTKLALASAEFDVLGKTYAAVPLAAASGKAQALARVDLGRAERASPAPAVSVQYADNPEVAVKLAELEKLKRENAAKTELKALESQIAELKRGSQKSYASDVDQPAFPPKAPRPDDLALVIGIESYQDSHLPKADFAQRDAEAVAAHLTRLGVPEGNIVRLIGDKATAGRIKGYLESWLPKNAKPGSKVYFYYSGHGAPDPASHDAYLLSWDGDPGLLKTTAVSLAEVYASLGRLPAEAGFVQRAGRLRRRQGRGQGRRRARQQPADPGLQGSGFPPMVRRPRSAPQRA